jgi:diguanylate cyclase (GGDEF)-like protein
MDSLEKWIADFASGGAIVLLLLLLTVAMRLFHSRRKKAYFTLLLAVAIMLGEYGLRTYLAEFAPAEAARIPFWIHVLQICAFITINMGIYQLYNRLSGRRLLLAAALLALAGAAAWLAWQDALPVAGPVAGPDAPAGPPAAFAFADSFLILDLYLLLLIPLAFFLVTRSIGQTGKFRLGLAAYLAMHLSHLAGRHFIAEPHPLIRMAESLLPVAFLFVLLLFVIDRLVELLQAVYVSSITDGLTGLYTRSFLLRRLAQYLQHGYRIGVIFCDIDNFKRLNDTQGHQAGDEALKSVARILSEQVEDIGLAGRYGGEELVAMITDPKAKPGEVAESIRSRVERETGVTVSVGWSSSGRSKKISGDTLLKQADEAMYFSKSNGKNRVTSWQQLKKAEKQAKAGPEESLSIP